MDDVNIHFEEAFRCPCPCKAEVVVEQQNVTRCHVCGKEFNRGEITELLLSQGRFLEVTDADKNAGTRP
jgi:hypothetical protein